MKREWRSAQGTLDVLTPALLTGTTGNTSDENRPKLHRIKMPPFLLRSMVIDATKVPAFGTLHFLADVLKTNLYRLAAHQKGNVIDVPCC